MKIKTKKMLVKILSLLLLLIGYVTVEAFYFGPKRLDVNYKTLEHIDIPASFDDFTIVFFSDTHYLAYENNEKLQSVVDTIIELQPDLILFSGDLIDHPANNQISVEQQQELIDLLSKLEAPYGKYAVYGNHDLEGLTTRENTNTILSSAGFQMINNKNMKIHKDDSYIRLIGLDSMHLGSPDLVSGYDGILVNDFTLLLCHTPDIADTINTKLTDIIMSGHSHGHQIYIPFISRYFLPPHGTTYSRGIYRINDETSLYVTNGTGTTASSARLFANSEVIFFRLKKSN